LLGAFLGVEDRSGRLVWGLAQFPNEGAYFVVPGLDECDRIEHSQLMGAPSPPPCPVR